MHSVKLIRLITLHPGISRYFENTSWMLGEQLLRIIAQLFVGLWVARYLGPAQFGIFSYAIALGGILGGLAKLGLDHVVIRNLIEDADREKKYISTAFWLKLLGAVLILAIVASVIEILPSSSAKDYYVVIITMGFVFQSMEVIDFYFQSKVLAKYVSLCRAVQLGISSLIKIYLIFIQSSLMWFMIAILLDQMFLSVFLFLAYRFYTKKNDFLYHFDLAIAKTLLQDSWPLIMSAMFTMIYMRIDQVMIRFYLNDYELGIYSAVTRISEVSYFVPMLITASLFPAIINAKKVSQELYLERLERLYILMIWLAIAIAVPVSIFSNQLVVVMYGEMYVSAGLVLSVHVWANIFVFIGVASSKWFISNNLQKYQIVNTAVGACINILLNIVLIKTSGIIGAAIATVISYGIAGYFMSFLFAKTRENFYLSTRAFNPLKVVYHAKNFSHTI